MDKPTRGWTLADAYDRFNKLKDPYGSLLFCAETYTDETKYGTSRIEDFWRSYCKLDPDTRQVSEVIRPHTPCRLYLELMFHKDVNPGVSGEPIVELLVELIIKTLKLYHVFCSKENVLIMDSSSKAKFNQQLIFHTPNYLFKDNKSAGDFMKNMIFDVRTKVENKEEHMEKT